MFSKKGMLSLLAISFFLAAPVFADEAVSLKGDFLILNPKGVCAACSDPAAATRTDLEDGIGYPDNGRPLAEAGFGFDSQGLSGSYSPIRFSGNDILQKAIIFNGQTFNFGAEVKSEIDIDLYDVGLTWHLINFDNQPVRFQLGPELSVKVLDADGSIHEKGIYISEGNSMTAPVPTIGARSRVVLGDNLGLIGRVGLMDYDGDNLLDADAQLEISPLPCVGIFAGYRYIDMDVDESGVLIDAKLDGFYGGVVVRF